MQLRGKKVLVFGAAKSGISAAGLLLKQGAEVVLYDSNPYLTEDTFKDRIDIHQNFTLATGELFDEILKDVELVVLSPGVAFDHPDILRIKNKNLPIWGEIELAGRFAKGKIIGITGTNGKTTTTSLVGEIMKTSYDEVYVVGNIGTAFSDVVLTQSEMAINVIELSSFQLETIEDFKPDISAILNITPDHLDRHHSMEQYIMAKERIAKNQSLEEVCILNYEDVILKSMASRLNTRVSFFSSKRVLDQGVYLLQEEIRSCDGLKEECICNVNELRILGNHNYENVMAAVSIALTLKVPTERIRKALLDFHAVEHRIEYVETIGGVTYYNDSKGTNPDASIKAVQAMKNPTILIAGGYDKNLPFDELMEACLGKVKLLVLLGQTREQIARTAIRFGFDAIIMVNSLKEAVRVSYEKADPGDAVLLSPACASFGMFENYEQRGRLFKEYVRELL